MRKFRDTALGKFFLSGTTAPYVNPGTLMTYVRFGLVPLNWYFLLNGHYLYAGISILLSGLTDFLDGFLSRKLNCQSTYGATIDPWADKAMLLQIGCFDYIIFLTVLPLELLGLQLSSMVRKEVGKHLIARGSKTVTALQMMCLFLLCAAGWLGQHDVHLLDAALTSLSYFPFGDHIRFLSVSVHELLTGGFLTSTTFYLACLIILSGYRVIIYSRCFTHYKRQGYFKDPEERIYTAANALTLLRMACLPLFHWLFFSGYTGWSYVVFSIACLSDGADGYVARTFNQCSVIGKRLDPLADKLCLIGVGTILYFKSGFPYVIEALVLTGIFEIISGIYYKKMCRYNDQILWGSKVMTTLQGLSMLLILTPLSAIIPLLIAPFSLIRSFFYRREWLRLKKHNASLQAA